MSNKSGTAPQVVTLPTGGGALQGIGETFSPDPFTGTGNFTVPIAVPAGRNGFQPSLSLSYSTGSGNGPFGLGWALPVPNVSRKTSKGVPQYRDESEGAGDRDTFVFSGADDLVEVAEPEAAVTRFRPRTEGLFALVDRDRSDGGDVWQVSTRDGLVSRYGASLAGGSDPAVVADPADRTKVFSWQLTETTDPFGNRIEYEYLRDAGDQGGRRWDQLYLQRVRYVDFGAEGDTAFLVSVTFVYDERPDPFSEHRAGFEIRTRLRCRRIEIRTHAEGDVLARSYELEYLDDLVSRDERPVSDLPLNGVSLLARVRVVGHDGERTQEMPPLDFDYTRFAPERQRFQAIDATDGTLPPVSLADADLETVDLFGDGLPDIVQMNGSVLFWRNRGDGRYDEPQEMSEVPAGVQLRDPGVQFADMNGDGRADLLVLPQGGYFPLGFGGRWSPDGFVQYASSPTVEFGVDDLRLVDLDGDGVIDALRTGPDFELFFNDPQSGWDRVETRPRRPIEEFPDVSFADPRVKLADLDGDGLQDIVLVDQGRIDYWPYLGHGNWGRRIRMDASPVFTDQPPLPEGFDARRVLVGDLDGDGLDDIVYVQDDRMTFWINQGGERWSAPITVESTPEFADIDAVRLTDLLGTGMNGVLWTSDPVPGAGSHYQFLDLTSGLKPYLLERMDNHLGAVTSVGYASSTKFRLADETSPGTRWATPLPFPVQVVERVEIIDEISGGKLTNRFHYHHGYWDGAEREFRGFGLVDQFDSETFTDFHAGDQATFAAVDERQFSPPVLTRTWFHQGPVGEEFEDWHEQDRSTEFWPEDPPALAHVEDMEAFLRSLPTRRSRRDALRALRGSVLRTELYAVDDSPLSDRPYTVTEVAYALREESPVPPDGDDRPHVFFPHAVGERTSQWERGSEPMTSFSFTDDHDEFGQPRRSIALAVPRGRAYRKRGPSGEPYLGTTTGTTFGRPGDGTGHIVDRVARVTEHEVRNDGRPSVFQLRDAVREGTAELAIVGQTLTYYDGEAFEGLPLGELGRFGAPVRTETLVLTEEILGDDVPPYLDPEGPPEWTDEYPQAFRDATPDLAGYIFSPGGPDRERGYFAQEARHRYDVHDDPDGRGLVVATRDPLGRDTNVDHDEFGLLPVRVEDGAALSTSVVNDYRVLQPQLSMDVNENRTAFGFTPLGLLEHVAAMGKEGGSEGDTVDAPGVRYVYDLLAASSPEAGGQPISVRTTRRVHHLNEAEVPPADRNVAMETVEYSDGFGRLIQTRTQADDTTFGDERFGEGVIPVDQDDPDTHAEVVGRVNDQAQPSVVVSGWTVHDNKGHVVERFEPFFATGWEFRPAIEAELRERVTTSYDPLGRQVLQVNPDGSEQQVVCGIPVDLADPLKFTPTPWEAFTYDANDNAGRTHPTGATEYEHHWDTPQSVVLDALGRPVTATQRTRAVRSAPSDPMPPLEEVPTSATYDIRGNLVAVSDAAGRDALAYLFDLAGRPLRTLSVDAGECRIFLGAAGHELERRDGKGGLTLRTHDVLGRTSRVWARDDAQSEVTLRERLEYGDGGDPHQAESSRAEARARNLLGALHEHYDEAGRVTFVANDFKGNTLERVRRVIGDETLLGVFPSPDDPAPDWRVAPFRVDWEPPEADSLEEHAARLLGSAVHETAAHYDALNRARTIVCPAGSDGERRTVDLAYDGSGALVRLSVDQATIVERIVYDAKGQRTLVALGNGVMTRYSYDPQTLRLLRLRSERFTKPSPDVPTYRPVGDVLQDLGYRHDLVGNVVDVVDRTPGSGIRANPDAGAIDDAELRALVAAGDALVRRFAYDPLYQLVSASGRECTQSAPPQPWADGPRCGFGTSAPNRDNAPNLTGRYTQAFEYDTLGNLTRLSHSGPAGTVRRDFQLSDGSNRVHRLVSGQTTIDYLHDASGNVLQETTSRHFEWDHRDRMKSFRVQAGTSEPSVHAQYLYDAGGERIKKLVRTQGGGIEVSTYVDGVFEERRWRGAGAPDGANSTLRVADGSTPIALLREGQPHPAETGPAVQYVLGDHIGSCSVITDGDSAFVNREEFSPYGETSFGSFARKRYRFCGKERDEESGLGRHGLRYYAPWLGRWTSCDPAGAVDGPALYTYCRNNPYTMVDPTGLQSQPPEVVPGESYGSYGGNTVVQQYDSGATIVHAVDGTYYYYAPGATEATAMWADLDEAWVPMSDEPGAFQAADTTITVEGRGYVEGLKGERIRFPGVEGAPRDRYTKPMAIYAAEQGKYDAAELYENYMCPSCHVTAQVGHIPSDAEFSLQAYNDAVIEGYAFAQGMVSVVALPFEVAAVGASGVRMAAMSGGRMAGGGSRIGAGFGSSGGRAAGGGAWTRVSRWMSSHEADVWKGRYTMPQPLPKTTGAPRFDVAGFGARRPGGVDPIRLDFSVPTQALKSERLSGSDFWYSIFNESRSVPVRDLVFTYPP